MYQVLAKELDCDLPNQSFEKFITTINNFEKHYGVIDFTKGQVDALINLFPDLRELFIPNATKSEFNLTVSDIYIDKMKPYLEKLEAEAYIQYSIGEVTLINCFPAQGVCSPLTITIQQKYKSISDQIFDKQN